MLPRLLVIGASGFVGSWWAEAARPRFEVVRASRNSSTSARSVAIEITDPASVDAALARFRPQYVTLLAAMSDIDRCQREPELAERVNVEGAANVARACARFGARLLYTSTDAVFDGTRGIYREDDPPSPPNVYGQTKARAEPAILETLPSATIVRMSLVLGRTSVPQANSYLEKVASNLKAGNPIISTEYEYRNPIDISTLCEFLLELTVHDDAAGVFHLGASDKISRYELARELARRLGENVELVVPQTAPVGGRAPRGWDDFLATDRLRNACRTPVPNCQQVIERALAPWPGN